MKHNSCLCLFGCIFFRMGPDAMILFQLCYIDPGIASGDEVELLKTVDSVFLEL